MVWSVGGALIRRVRHLLAERSHERGGHGALPSVSNCNLVCRTGQA
jgi:hypothetical protein